MNNEIFHVACNIDSKYTRYCGVLMISLFENNKESKIKMHILGYHLTTENKNDLKKIAINYHNDIQFYDVNEEMFKEFPVSEQWPIVIYFRLMLPELISKDVERVLYVDCDIIFRGPIQDLMNIDLKGNIIGAVEDKMASPYAPYLEMLGYDPKYQYFNSGVLLIDIKKWNNSSISEKCIAFIKENKVIHPDQDALNAILHDKWIRLTNRWNNGSALHTRYISMEFFIKDFNKETKSYPVIIHFSGIKPWDSRCRDPFKDDFYKYQALTKWHNCIPKHSIKEWIYHGITLILDRIGIRKINPFYKFNIKK